MAPIIQALLKDADPQQEESLPIRIVIEESAISILPQGYGDFGTAVGHGCPVYLELYQGRLRLVVFADINKQDPTHIIDLERAKESLRADRSTDLDMTDEEALVVESEERLLDIEYRCPECGHEWAEQWSCACDSQCPTCGLKNIEALSWVEAN